MTRRIAVVSAGVSEPSTTRKLADRLSRATVGVLAERAPDEQVHVQVVELREHAHALIDNVLTGFASRELAEMISSVTSADALIVATPIFSTSYSGLFKSFIDVLDPDALTGMPVLIGANAGTARHSLAIDYAIRPLFAYLHARPVSTGVFAAAEDWAGGDESVAPLSARIDRGARELADLLVGAGPRQVADPFDPQSYLGAGGSFEDLLRDGPAD